MNQIILVPETIPILQVPEQAQTLTDLCQSQIILNRGAIHTIQHHPESRITLDLNEILILQVLEVVETMQAPG